jgi:energy-coupling factor transporter ATP-binding protein EcfA2
MKLKKKFIAIIGERNSGKSTIIRALTGCKGVKLPIRVEDRSTSDGLLLAPFLSQRFSPRLRVSAVNWFLIVASLRYRSVVGVSFGCGSAALRLKRVRFWGSAALWLKRVLLVLAAWLLRALCSSSVASAFSF